MNSNLSKIQYLEKKGTLLTFNKCLDNGNIRIISNGLEYSDDRRVRIKGQAFNTQWFNSIDDLVKSIDWIYMKQYGFCRELV